MQEFGVIMCASGTRLENLCYFKGKTMLSKAENTTNLFNSLN